MGWRKYKVKPLKISGYNIDLENAAKIINLDIELALIEKVLNENDKIRDLLNYKPILLQSDKVKLKNNVFKKLI